MAESYKLKKIYIWVDNQEKQVRPISWTVSGSVDFRNVTKADLTAQWWLTSWEPYVALNSTNWLYCSATSNDKYAWLYMPMDFTNAKKATITWEFRQDKRSWSWWPRFGITQTNDVDKNSFVAFVNFCSEGSYQQQEIDYVDNSWNYTYLAKQSISLTWWNYTIKLEINFETWEIVKTVTGATPYTQTWTLTSELISTIRQFWYIAQRVWWWMPTASYCYTMAYEIEY